MFTTKNLAYELPHELSKNLRFRILGNYEILDFYLKYYYLKLGQRDSQ